MEQLEYKHIKELKFSDYLFDLNQLDEGKLADLEILINKYPYCQTLYLLAAKTAQNTPNFTQKLAQAAAMLPDRTVLYHVIHHPDKLNKDYTVAASQEKEIQPEALVSIIEEDVTLPHALVDVPSETESETALEADSFNHDDEVYEEIADVVVEHISPADEEVKDEHDLNFDTSTPSEFIIEEETEEVVESAQEEAPNAIAEDVIESKEETATTEEVNLEPVFVEIETPDQNTLPFESIIRTGEVTVTTEQVPENDITEEEQPIVETVAAQEPYIENIAQEIEEPEHSTKSEQIKALQISQQKNYISKYDDERLPYTFLWWLAKTRKEYENIQPYASFKLDTSKEIAVKEDVLSHQIAENIFHLRTVDDLTHQQTQTVPFDFRRKEYQIIERFIKEEPQIKPPPANKIDTENKAKRSSEDSHELVSETLAKVYVEQMLYHKALEVYKKLSLKYPEKSTYFASQIKYLELKVN
ncbi:hypothetical protein FYC62_15255 [Pedobacter aquae]|uniref:Tetratricopeptide repeat protein n=1 Tax=Pedobacter aquae TaxID=2605747 RepID=A0A5C0VPQ4_9SPHI|nr:hypothetical protein [Pedobacter aquae]QEK52874.1 hypothetical protein FYC62_15255 [Pedobacter aquae]